MAEGEAKLHEDLNKLSQEEQVGCLFYVAGYMSGQTEWPMFREAVEAYLKIFLSDEEEVT